MNNYYDYFKEQPHELGRVSMDEFVSEAMRTDIKFRTPDEELNFLQHSRITLKNELLTCYEFMKHEGLLEQYHAYRDGE